MRSLDRTTTLLALVLVVAVTVEVLLFRIFARGGVYFIDDNTPLMIQNGYTSLVFSGNVLFNYAAPVTLLAMVVAAIPLVARSSSLSYRAIGVVVMAVAAVSGLMVLGYSGEALSDTYWAVSGIAVAGISVIALRKVPSKPLRLFVVMTALSYLAIYGFKSGQALPGIGGVNLLTIGEWVGLASFLTLGFVLRSTLNRRALIVASVVALGAGGMAFGRADSIPLIATWAFGLSLSAPYWLYIAALWIVLAFSGSAIARGQYLTGVGVLLVFFGHRGLPLTYFNDLAICGLLFVVREVIDVNAPVILGKAYGSSRGRKIGVRAVGLSSLFR